MCNKIVVISDNKRNHNESEEYIMSTIGGLTSSTVNDIRGYGGLASGLDTDSLIEQMTYGTQSKIDSMNQKLDLQKWEQEVIRSITTSMNDFYTKYTSFSSSSNLLTSSMYSSNVITALGENADNVSVSGSGNFTSNISILGVKQLATNASMTTKTYASDRTLSFNAIEGSTLAQEVPVDKLRGETLYLDIDGRNLSITLKEGDYSSIEDAVRLINETFEESPISNTVNLSDLIKVQQSASDPTKLEFVQGSDDSNTVKILESSNNLLKNLGFDEVDASGKAITSDGFEASNTFASTEMKTLAETLSGKKLIFDYNGTTSTITLGDFTESQSMSDVQADLQSKLDSAFGKDRVRVGLNEGVLSFSTTIPGTEDASGSFAIDQSSVISLLGGDSDLLGENGLFGVSRGESNRVNLDTTFDNSGLLSNSSLPVDFTTEMKISNANGQVFDLRSEEYGLTEDSTINEIIDTINNIKELGINITYQETMDKFVVNSTEQGASGTINLSGNVADALFGGAEGVIVDGVNNNIENGTDSVVTVSYGGDSYVDLIRSSNTVELDGLSIKLEDTFGEYDATTGEIILGSTDAVTFDAKVDTKTTADTVEEMINDYNKILADLTSEINTQYDRDYQPLTSTQRAEMSESQIEVWDEKAKEGLLFNDSDLRNLLSDMRFLLPLSLQHEFTEIGITTSSNYEDNGKLIFDKTKFEEALAEDPNNVMNLMMYNGSSEQSNSEDGLIVGMKEVIEKYAGMTGVTKGILVERAGSELAPTTILDNSIQDAIDDMNESIEKLQDLLETETDRYIAQFTELETVIAQMNSQSSMLSSLSTGY